ncbi:hypothetical protein ACFQZK_02805 [Rhodococcus aetherivorans]
MSDSEQRTSILGSEIARRGLIPVPEPVLFAYAAALMVSMFLFVFFGSTIWTLAGVLAVVGGTLWATTDMGGRRSWAGRSYTGSGIGGGAGAVSTSIGHPVVSCTGCSGPIRAGSSRCRSGMPLRWI